MTSALPREHAFLNGTVAALEWGEPGHPVWLALHGWLDNAASFSRLAPLLTEALNIRILALDLPGQGQSAHKPHEMDYSPWGYAATGLDVLDELGLQQTTLLGHSMGAIVANVLAASFPERVERLVLIDGLVGKLMQSLDTPEQIRQGILAQQKRTSLPARRFPDTETAIITRVRKSVLPITREAAAPIIRRNLRPVPGSDAVELTTDDMLKQPRTLLFTADQSLAILRAIQAPTLLIACLDGGILARDTDRQFRDSLQHLTEADVPGGHHAHAEEAGAQRIAQTVTAWASGN